MKISPETYIWPPRPTAAIPFEDAKVLYDDLGWTAQLKYNDTRLLIKIQENGDITLWNRHAEQLRSYHCPDHLMDQLSRVPHQLKLGDGYHLLDGGLLDQKHSSIKDTIAIWDILVQNGEHLLDTVYEERYKKLNPRISQYWDSTDETAFIHEFPTITAVLGERLTDNIFVPRLIPPNEWEEAWGVMQEVNRPYLDVGQGPALEGLVFKDLEGILEMGWQEKNNDAWSARSRFETGRHAF